MFNKQDWLHLFLVLLLTIAFHYSFLADLQIFTWTKDDPAIIGTVKDKNLLTFFFEPETWRSLSPFNYTPFLSFSYGVDYFLFKTWATGYYLHHFFMLILLNLAIYIFLKIHVRKVYLIYLAVGMVSFNFIMVYMLRTLMVRHYLEGLLFLLISLIFFHFYLTNRKKIYGLAGGLFYLVACFCKEVYVPGGFLIAVLPTYSWRDRIRAVLCLTPMAALYSLLRLYMLGANVIGGYPGARGKYDNLTVFFHKIAGTLNFDVYTGGILVILLISATLISMTRFKFHGILGMVVLGTICILPIFPVIQGYCVRFYFFAYVVFTFWIVFTIHYAGRYWRYILSGLIGLFIVLSGFDSLAEIRSLNKDFLLQAREYRFLINHYHEKIVFLKPRNAYLKSLLELYGKDLSKRNLIYCYDKLLCMDLSGYAYYTWKDEEIQKITIKKPASGQALSLKETDAAGYIEFYVDQVRWFFDLSQGGLFFVNYGPVRGIATLIPPNGQLPMVFGEDFEFLIKYVDEQGRVYFSDIKHIDSNQLSATVPLVVALP